MQHLHSPQPSYSETTPDRLDVCRAPSPVKRTWSPGELYRVMILVLSPMTAYRGLQGVILSTVDKTAYRCAGRSRRACKIFRDA